MNDALTIWVARDKRCVHATIHDIGFEVQISGLALLRKEHPCGCVTFDDHYPHSTKVPVEFVKELFGFELVAGDMTCVMLRRASIGKLKADACESCGEIVHACSRHQTVFVACNTEGCINSEAAIRERLDRYNRAENAERASAARAAGFRHPQRGPDTPFESKVEPGMGKDDLPPWFCTKCEQTNAGWVTDCGRCERARIENEVVIGGRRFDEMLLVDILAWCREQRPVDPELGDVGTQILRGKLHAMITKYLLVHGTWNPENHEEGNDADHDDSTG